PPPPPPRRGAPQSWEPPRLNAAWLLSDIFADHSIPIKSGCGWLPGEWLNEEGLHMALRHMGRVPAMRIANYGHPYGYAPLRETIAATLSAQGMEVEVSQVLLTQGVTHGLDMVIRTLLRPGDTVLVEQPAYANLLQMLRLAGLRVVPVARTLDGLDCEALEQAASQHRPRALFVNTALQNPSGASISMANAFRILQLAERHGLWVVEDDISRELAPGVTPMLAALDGGRRVVYLGGYSKVISPSVRVGYVVAHRDLARDIARTKMAVGLTSPEIMERIVHQVIREGRYRAHIERTRERLAQAHATVAELMAQHGFEIYAQPRAGLFLWAKVAGQWRERGANGLAGLALKDGIWLAPGSYFEADEADTPWVRFNVAYSEAPALWRFMRNEGAA
ncbi:PLP-dependent aminotransferase family protein, partial [Achromobacter xylosoxidans]